MMQFEAKGFDSVFTLYRGEGWREDNGHQRVLGEVAASLFPAWMCKHRLYWLGTPVTGGDLLLAGQGVVSVCQVIQYLR